MQNCGRKAVTAQIACNGVDIQDIKVGTVNWAEVTVEDGSSKIEIKDIDIEYSYRFGVIVHSEIGGSPQTGITIENIDCKYAVMVAVTIDTFVNATLLNIIISKGDNHGIKAMNGDELTLNNIKLKDVKQNSLSIINVAKVLKVYDVHSVNPCQGTTNVDCFYFSSNNAFIEHRNNKITSDTDSHRYSVNMETSPNFLSSFGCDYVKGLSDAHKYAGWNPKNARDIFGGNRYK